MKAQDKIIETQKGLYSNYCVPPQEKNQNWKIRNKTRFRIFLTESHHFTLRFSFSKKNSSMRPTSRN